MEIERKWLLNSYAIPWKQLIKSKKQRTVQITQQYLGLPENNGGFEERIRRVKDEKGESYFHTLKSYDSNNGLAREEKEVEISREKFYGSFNTKNGNIIEKTRYYITVDGVVFEIDIYQSPKNLAIVEIEFDDIESAKRFTAPTWFSLEVTNDSRYKNVNLARNGLRHEKKTTEIVLTGGPCGGKSSVLAELKSSLDERGYKVLISKEVATEVMESGALPWELTSYIFQGAILEKSLDNEKKMKVISESYRQNGKDVVIFYDRGLADGGAYCDAPTWKTLLKENGLSEEMIRNRYDAVFHIETTAYGAEDVYIKQMNNNAMRYENTVEAARETEDKTKSAWRGHHNLIVFGNSDGWEAKKNAICSETYRMLGMAPIIRSERKYLVDEPTDLDKFIIDNNCVEQQIEQIYLKDRGGVERRIRKIGDGKNFTYYYTEKEGSGESRIKREKIIDSELYHDLAIIADPNKKVIQKMRYSFLSGQEYFALDVFEDGILGKEDKGKAILESKGAMEPKPKNCVPSCITTAQDVTNNAQFANAMLASKCDYDTDVQKEF